MSNVHVPEVIQSITSLVDHLTTTTVHPWFPYGKFAVLHAVRVSVVWASLTRGRKTRRGDIGREGRDAGKVGVLGDLFGYLVMCCESLLLLSSGFCTSICASYTYDIMHLGRTGRRSREGGFEVKDVAYGG